MLKLKCCKVKDDKINLGNVDEEDSECDGHATLRNELENLSGNLGA